MILLQLLKLHEEGGLDLLDEINVGIFEFARTLH